MKEEKYFCLLQQIVTEKRLPFELFHFTSVRPQYQTHSSHHQRALSEYRPDFYSAGLFPNPS